MKLMKKKNKRNQRKKEKENVAVANSICGKSKNSPLKRFPTSEFFQTN